MACAIFFRRYQATPGARPRREILPYERARRIAESSTNFGAHQRNDPHWESYGRVPGNESEWASLVVRGTARQLVGQLVERESRRPSLRFARPKGYASFKTADKKLCTAVGRHLVPTILRNTPLWLYFRSVRSSEKLVKLKPTPTFRSLPM